MIGINRNERSQSPKYASHLLWKLREVYEFCFVTKNKKKYLDEHFVDCNCDLHMFYAETLSPCLAYESLLRIGVLETGYSADKINRFFITFIANLKMIFGGLPDYYHGISGDFKLSLPYDHIESLGLHLEHFSFRELTLLGGYQTERAVRNLASPSTPEHRRLSVIKEGRFTYVTREEAMRWLSRLNRN
ncbi:hypothetical protein [Vibrio sp. PID23_8]|uniref:hypothetical protein n=1 Tax=Vibrio sp. PID23_8 TaxID=1583767 RepID=UPI000EE5E9F4|nr:hypothetical protein [Vibrio sp. PID23_8]RIZ55343.1 hypothetical protein AK966_08490 [Vibrio sp. PID23_8]